MTRHERGFEIELISTCPASSEAESSGCRERVVSHGYRTFLLDIPSSEEDLEHARSAFDRALDGAVAA